MDCLKVFRLLVLFFFSTQFYFGQLSNGLILKYDFNGNLNDQSVMGNNGIFNGNTYVNGANGLMNNAAHFDGTSSVILPNVPSLKPSLPITVSFLVKLDDLNDFHPIYHSDVYYNNYSGFMINIDPTGQIGVHISAGLGGAGPTNRRSFFTNQTIGIGTWHRITVVIKAYNNMSVYIDCVKATGTYSGTGATTMTYSINDGRIGQSGGNPVTPLGHYLRGSLDELSVWNRELLTYEILGLCDCQPYVYPSNGKLVHYPFNGNAIDITTNVNGVLVGATPTNDRNGNANQALYFDGINDYIVLPNNPIIKSPLPISVAFWVRIDQANPQQFFHTDHLANTNYGYWFGIDPANKVHINFGGGQASNSGGRRSKTSGTALTIGQWHHVIGVIRGVNDMDIYIDCVDAGGTYSGTGVTTMSYSSNDGRIASTFQINPNPILYLNGAMDEFAIWNRSLSAVEVSSMCGCLTNTMATVDTTLNVTSCDTYSLNGVNYNQSGSYSQLTTSVFGMDSIINLNLTINNSNTTILNYEECNSVFYNGVNHTSSGAYNYTFTNVNGCDSIVTANITILPNIQTQFNVNVCQGDDVILPDGTIQSNVQSNFSFNNTYITFSGCDSLVTINYNVNTPSSLVQNLNICSGQNVTFPDGTTQNNIITNTSHISTLVATSGCDSIVTTNIIIQSTHSSTEEVSACIGNVLFFPDGFSEIINGNTSHVSNLVSQFGCDSIVTTNVTALLNSTTQQFDTVCFGQNYIFPDGNILPSIIQNTVYNSIFTNSNGCDSIIETHVEVLPAPVSNFTFSPIIPTTLDNEVTFSPLSFVEQTYYWNIIDAENNELFFSNDSILTFTFESNYLSPFTICLNTESNNGCISSVCQEIILNSDVLVFVPNGFTPNNDKINDTFYPVIFSNQFENYEFQIFDRWGLLVFSSTIYTEGWDGTYKGEYAPIDTYTYKLYFKDINSVNEHRFIGHVSLIR